MRKIRDVLRRKFEVGLSDSRIATAIARSTVHWTALQETPTIYDSSSVWGKTFACIVDCAVGGPGGRSHFFSCDGWNDIL